MSRNRFLPALILALVPLSALADETPPALSDYIVFGCRQGEAALTPFVFRRTPGGGIEPVTGEGTGDVTDGGRIVQVTEPEPGTLVVSRGATTLRFSGGKMTTLGPTGGSQATSCLRLDEAFLTALGAVADDRLKQGAVPDEIAALQRAHLERQTRAAEAEAEAARTREAREAERSRRQPTVENWHIGGAPTVIDNGRPAYDETDLLTAYILSNRELLDSAPVDPDLRRDLDDLYNRLERQLGPDPRRWSRR
ncbi:hypothetical protein V8J36_17230 [Frigidibacter sp. MR17.14]|uniref:hypothetical protein n=1 Tax=Frigidibacter sp. MR17.14 TaxID=3126509 RepID=UPI003012FF04